MDFAPGAQGKTLWTRSFPLALLLSLSAGKFNYVKVELPK